MKFCWCTIMVGNLEESLKFYQEIVGLSVARRFAAGPDTEIAFMDGGGAEIELLCESGHPAPGNKEGISLGFEVGSVDEQMKLVREKGISIEGGPVQPNPRVKFFFVKDPNGVTIQFVENM